MIEKYSPDKVAEMIISIDPTFHLPSDEQRPIISIYDNPLEPAVVIAGAQRPYLPLNLLQST